jgi:hypothetical protein
LADRGVLLVLSFISHDLFMAAQAAVTLGELHTGRQQYVAPAPPSGDGGATLGTHSSEPTHPDGCGVVQIAIPRTVDEPEALAGELIDRLCQGVIAELADTAALHWDEPEWPLALGAASCRSTEFRSLAMKPGRGADARRRL